jgi:hypothetical protein
MVVIAGSSTGCSNAVGTDGLKRVDDSDVEYSTAHTSGSNSGATAGGEEKCQNRAYNVLPKNEQIQPGNFTACTLDDDFYSIELVGEIETPDDVLYSGGKRLDTFCVLPAQVYGSTTETHELTEPTRVVFKQDNEHLPMYNCYQLAPNTSSIKSLKVTFDKTYFDYIFVVAHADLTAMRACLIYKTPHLCPKYAGGQFRSIPRVPSGEGK